MTVSGSIYAELDGIWHFVHDGQTACGRAFIDATELDFEPRLLCWRCRESARELRDRG